MSDVDDNPSQPANSSRWPLTSRRQFCQFATGGMLNVAIDANLWGACAANWEPRYLLASCLYGYSSLSEILPEVRKTGATAIDLWPKVHGNQREQLEEMGEAAFEQLLERHDVSLGCLTQYALGPFRLQDELRMAQRLGCRMVVTNCPGQKGLKGSELKQTVANFLEQMKPHLEVAEQTDVVIAIENHSNSLVDSTDALLYLNELNASPHLGIAFAPYHLVQDEAVMSECLNSVGAAVHLFYAWQYGKGCMSPQPKADELLQMPGRGDLDFGPLIRVLRDLQYQGWVQIFMHPYPRGVSIRDTVEEVTSEINRARDYLQTRLATL